MHDRCKFTISKGFDHRFKNVLNLSLHFHNSQISHVGDRHPPACVTSAHLLCASAGGWNQKQRWDSSLPTPFPKWGYLNSCKNAQPWSQFKKVGTVCVGLCSRKKKKGRSNLPKIYTGLLPHC